MGNTSLVAGYVLAGGASRRFGRDKALAVLGGQTLLGKMRQRVEAALGNVGVVATEDRYGDIYGPVVPDRWPGQGPLGGILTALQWTPRTRPECKWNLIVSCDMPFLTSNWLGYMAGQALVSDNARGSLVADRIADNEATDVILCRSEQGLEPLCACWRTSASAKIEAEFERGVRKVRDAIRLLPMEILDETHWKRFDSDGRLFWNMNTPQDYQDALRAWSTDHPAEHA